MPGRVINKKIVRQPIGVAMKVGDLLLAGKVLGTVHESSINSKSESERCIGRKGEDGLTVLWSMVVVMFTKRASLDWPRA